MTLQKVSCGERVLRPVFAQASARGKRETHVVLVRPPARDTDALHLLRRSRFRRDALLHSRDARIYVDTVFPWELDARADCQDAPDAGAATEYQAKTTYTPKSN